MFNFPKELVIILIIVLVIFGPKRLPELGKSLGKTMRELRDGIEGNDDDKSPADASEEAESSDRAAASSSAASHDAKVAS